MSGTRTYLDWNATAPMRPEARAAMLAALAETGNPSSVHAEGRRARAIIETAREKVAALLGTEAHNVIFTSGATEAANQALTPLWWADGKARPAGRLYMSAIEHPCVLSGGRFAPGLTGLLPVTSNGILDISVLLQTLKLHDPATGQPLVALMLANNETGMIQPVSQAAQAVHAANGTLVCDAVQAAGRIRINMAELDTDALFLSSHKLGGPKGAGALILARDTVNPAPLITGGGQERRQRSGTENVAAIAGFGAAAAAALADLVNMPRVAALRDRLETSATRDHSWSFLYHSRSSSDHSRSVASTGVAARLPNTTLLSLHGASAETLVIQLDLAGVAVSAGAACSSGKVKRSHVLDAMGVDPETASGTIRVSLGTTTTDDDVDRFLAAWAAIVTAHSARRAA